MTLPRTVADVLEDHVTLEVECIDRMYLNLYVPILQREAGVAHFWRAHRGYSFASSTLMAQMTHRFIRSIDDFAKREGVEIITFKKGQRKEDVAKEYLEQFEGEEGVLFIGKAQEKVMVVRTERRRNPKTGQTYPWLVRRSAIVNQYYLYCVDRDFGPFFIKFCSYFPYNGKVCINGHEYLKRQLQRRNIEHEALDNGILSCASPAKLKRISAGLTARKIDAMIRRWLRFLPHPFTAQDRAARYRYDVSILQAELSLTQVLDRPLSGRILFEQIIRDNIDIGRPDRVQLIFNRRITRRTPGRFRTRVIMDGVIPSLHIDYKASRIKQYHKEGRALRTETTINNARDFAIGKRLHNLPALQQVGYQANRRLLHVQRISHDCAIGETAFGQLQAPLVVDTQRVSGLRFGDPRVMALLLGLVMFRLMPRGFSNRELREHIAQLRGLRLDQLTQGMMTYDLRRLRLHGLIARVPKSHRYEVTPFGIVAALFLSRLYLRHLRPSFALFASPQPPPRLKRALERLESEVDRLSEHATQT